jgi:hypothetical protein
LGKSFTPLRPVLFLFFCGGGGCGDGVVLFKKRYFCDQISVRLFDFFFFSRLFLGRLEKEKKKKKKKKNQF